MALGGCQAAQNGVATAPKTVFCGVHFFAPSPGMFLVLLLYRAVSLGNLASAPHQKLLWDAFAFPKASFRPSGLFAVLFAIACNNTISFVMRRRPRRKACRKAGVRSRMCSVPPRFPQNLPAGRQTPSAKIRKRVSEKPLLMVPLAAFRRPAHRYLERRPFASVRTVHQIVWLRNGHVLPATRSRLHSERALLHPTLSAAGSTREGLLISPANFVHKPLPGTAIRGSEQPARRRHVDEIERVNRVE